MWVQRPDRNRIVITLHASDKIPLYITDQSRFGDMEHELELNYNQAQMLLGHLRSALRPRKRKTRLTPAP